MRCFPMIRLLIALSVLCCGQVYADSFEIKADPVYMSYEIVGTVPEEGFIIKGRGRTQIALSTKDVSGRETAVDRLGDLKAAVEVLFADEQTLRVAYRAAMLFPEEYWPQKGSSGEQFPSRMELEVPLDHFEKLDELKTGGYTERFAEELSGGSFGKLQALGYSLDNTFMTMYRQKMSQLLEILHGELPNQLRWMYERYLTQIEQEAAAAAENEARIKAEAFAARAEAEAGGENSAAEFREPAASVPAPMRQDLQGEAGRFSPEFLAPESE